MLDQIQIKKDRDTLLHILRNPHGWSEEVMREIRLKASDELERLWNLEHVALKAAKNLSDAIECRA